VVGQPVAHSLSPVLHGAAYAALGLDWTYERIERDADGLIALAGELDESWVGLSVTMPGKRAALRLAGTATERALAVGAANTLVRQGNAWHADCTDVDGVVGALRAAGGVGAGEGVILGAGGTACAALAGLAELDVNRAHLVVRDPARATDAITCAERVGVVLEIVEWADADFWQLADGAAVLVSTVPAESISEQADSLAAAGSVLDVIYHPWPTPLAEAVFARGGTIATGLDMLLHQAFGQVEQFTGLAAPREAMRDALREATGKVLDLPL